MSEYALWFTCLNIWAIGYWLVLLSIKDYLKEIRDWTRENRCPREKWEEEE